MFSNHRQKMVYVALIFSEILMFKNSHNIMLLCQIKKRICRAGDFRGLHPY